MDHVELRYSPAGLACLRELTGKVEQALSGATTVDAIRLIDGVLSDEAGAVLSAGDAATLTAVDRDMLLASIYRVTYGSRVESTLVCCHCSERFDLEFSLDQLCQSLQDVEADSDVTMLEDGTYRTRDGVHFRLPTGEDECRTRYDDPTLAGSLLLSTCLLLDEQEGLSDEARQRVEQALDSMLSVVDTELTAECPECGRDQTVHFDLQHYLLTSLMNEQKQLSVEIHRLASSYGWSLREILQLPRSQRRRLVALIESELV